MAQISLTELNSGNTFSVNDKDILKVVANGSDSLIYLDVVGSLPKVFEVDETAAAVFALSSSLISLTDTDSESTIYINAYKVKYTEEKSTVNGTFVYYNENGFKEERESVDDLQVEVIEKLNTVTGGVPTNAVKLMRVEYDYATTSKTGTFTDSEVSVANDTITISDHGFQNNDTVRLTSTGTLPTGLSDSTTYYVISATKDTFQVSTSAGGSAVNITAASGGGTHTARTNIIGDITFGAEGLLPDNAIVKRAYYDVVTTFTSSTDAATIALGIPTDDAAGIVAATAISGGGNIWDAGYHDGIQDGAAANFANKTTAERAFTMTVATEDLTAGKMVIFLEYVISE